MRRDINKVTGRLGGRKTLALLAGLLLLAAALAGCTDQADNPGGQDTPAVRPVTLQMMQQREALANVLAALAGVESTDTAGINFEGQTFTPNIGLAYGSSQDGVRAVKVCDESDAVLQFRSLVGGSFDLVTETDDGYLIDLTDLDCRQDGKRQSLGRLTFHRPVNDENVGYADVDIACIPKLKRILYMTDVRGFSGWTPGGWQSPCLLGQVWRRGSTYYLCVKESTALSDGWLISVQAGRGDNYRIVADNEGNKGAWGPRNEVSRDAVESFVYFCMNDAYIDMRRAIADRYPGQVIPFVPVPHGKGETCSWSTYGATDDGFGTMVKGYAHWVGGENTLNDSYYSPGTGPEVLIVRRGWMGDYAWVPARNYRHQEVFCMAPRHQRSANCYWYTKTYVYTSFGDSVYCDWLDSKYPYTANGFSFRASPPSGFGSSAVFDPGD